VRKWKRGSIAVLSTCSLAILSMKTATALQSEAPAPEPPALQTPPAPTPIRTPVDASPPIEPLIASPEVVRSSIASPPNAGSSIDGRALQQHVTAIARLVGQPSRELADRLGRAAIISDGAIEWNLADVGVAAGATYGYANVERGVVTGVVFRGRADLEALLALHFPRGIQLTRAGGERPSFSITAGE
jgi:hypothetical protein